MLERYRRKNNIILTEINSIKSISNRYHFLVEFFTRTDTHFHLRHIRCNSRGYVFNMIGRNLRDKDFASKMMTDGIHHHSHTSFQ